MPSNVVGNTFRAIELEPQATAELEFPKFVEALLQKLGLLKEERFLYYERLRKKKYEMGKRLSMGLSVARINRVPVDRASSGVALRTGGIPSAMGFERI
jgi:hypothetical protein